MLFWLKHCRKFTLSGIKKSLVILAKQVFSKLKRHETPSFAQLLYKFPSAIMVIIMKLSFPIFSIIKRCSIICANFNISPLEIIVSIILNYLNGRKTTTTTTTNKPQLKKKGGGVWKNHLWSMNMGILCPLKGMVSLETNEMVCSVTLLKPWLKIQVQ